MSQSRDLFRQMRRQTKTVAAPLTRLVPSPEEREKERRREELHKRKQTVGGLMEAGGGGGVLPGCGVFFLEESSEGSCPNLCRPERKQTSENGEAVSGSQPSEDNVYERTNTASAESLP